MFGAFERAVFLTVLDDLLGHRFTDMRNALEFFNGSGVDVY